MDVAHPFPRRNEAVEESSAPLPLPPPHVELPAVGIQVLARMGAILTVLEKSDAPVALGTIASATTLNKATVHRILNSLIELRLVERGPQPATYQLGIRALELGACVQRRLDVRTRALPYLGRLNSLSEETTFLCLRDGPWVLCIERLEGKHVAALQLKLGGVLPLHAGAASRVFLATLSAGELRAYADRDLERFTPRTLVDPARLVADTITTRQQGFAWSEEDVTVGVCAIGAPVFDLHGKVVAAVSISGILPRFTAARRAELIRQVREAARAISISLGYPLNSTLPWGLEHRHEEHG
jgi:DNA-binding IclR family transcriptional regulator